MTSSSPLSRLVAALALMMSFGLTEAILAHISGGRTLWADSLQMLIHSATLLVAFLTALVARRGGCHAGRIDRLGGMVNAVLLVAMGLFVAVRGIDALHVLHGQYGGYGTCNVSADQLGTLMGLMGLVSIAVHASCAWLLAAHHKNANACAAMWQMICHTIAMAGMVIGGLIISRTGWFEVDVYLSLGLAALMLFTGTRLVYKNLAAMLGL